MLRSCSCFGSSRLVGEQVAWQGCTSEGMPKKVDISEVEIKTIPGNSELRYKGLNLESYSRALFLLNDIFFVLTVIVLRPHSVHL